METRFDLSKALGAWRQFRARRYRIIDQDLDELEVHLRAHMTELRQQGWSAEAAFREAIRALGDMEEAEVEYRKVHWSKLKRTHKRIDELRWKGSMLKSYLKTALRTLGRQKGYTLINITGLALGLACFLLISLYVRFELSYDTFHEKADRIYRVVKEDPGNYSQGTNRYAVTAAPLAAALMDELPDVEYAVQVEPNGILLQREDKGFAESGIYATEHFFDVFSFRLLQGDPHTALAAPAAIILTESLAEKYFGTEDPIGQSLRTISNGEEGTLLVTGIIEDPPPYSHLIFDFVLSMTTSSQYRHQLETNQWDSDYYLTYVSLQPGYNLPAFEEKLIVLGQKYLGRLSNYQNKPDEISIFYPQSLGAIHLRSGLNHEVDTEGSINYVYLFSGIGLLILLIACINYTNMTMARSVIREREIGVRKVMGAQRPQLVGQFMSEALILSVVATVLAVGLVYLLLPSFNALTARAISPDWASQPGLWLTIIGLAIGVGCLTGGYPALVLSGLAPLGMMRKRQRRADNRTLRNGLVVAQFAITTMLIVCTLTIRQQVHYIQTANTGIEREQVILIRLVDQAAINQYEAIRQVLLEDPNVMGVTASRQDPTKIGSWTEAKEWEGAEEGQRLSFYHSAVRQGFLELLGIELVEGLDITGASESRDGLLINETMVRQLGWEHPVGKRINFQGREVRIAGVMKDFNFLSFHQAIAPLAFYQSEEWPFARLLVKVNPQQMQATLAHLESTMATFSPAYPFTYEFLDDVYNQMYQTEVRLGELFSYFTGIALVIAYMGLLGLAAFLASRRTKEIGVRKVLGASLSDILRLLSKDFLRLVGVAFIVGAPMAAIAMHRWLEDYVYRISLGWETFVIAGGAVLLLAWLSVSYQSMRAALINPVQSLRHK